MDIDSPHFWMDLKVVNAKKIGIKISTAPTSELNNSLGLSSVYLCRFSIAFAEDSKELANNDVPDNIPQYMTVFVSNLSPEVRNLIRPTLFPLVLCSGIQIQTQTSYKKQMGPKILLS